MIHARSLLFAAVLATCTGIPYLAHAASSHKVWMHIKGTDEAYAPAPDQVSIHVGDKVGFMNMTDSPHTITSRKPGVFDRNLPWKGTVTVTFKTPGTFEWYCKLHPDMHGVVIVKK